MAFPMSSRFVQVITNVRDGDAVLGEPLFVFGSGPLPIPGAEGAALALNRGGDAVLIVDTQTWQPGAAGAIADQVVKLATLSASELAAFGDGAGDGLAERHADFFATRGGTTGSVNREQKVVIVAPEAPSKETWRSLRRELGDQLCGVFVMQNGVAQRAVQPTDDERGDHIWSGLPFMDTRYGTWIAGAVLLILVTAAVALISRQGNSPATPSVATRVRPLHVVGPIAASKPLTLAGPASIIATDPRWIGQRKLASTPRGGLILAYLGPKGLFISEDRTGRGMHWSHPQMVSKLTPLSYSITAPSDKEIHIVYSDGHAVNFAVLQRAGSGWRKSATLQLDGASASPVVDLAYDSASSSDQVVWAKQVNGDQEPYWASVIVTRRGVSRVAAQALAGPASKTTVLANIAVDGSSGVVVTYRAGDSVKGWLSRFGKIDKQGKVTWANQVAVPTRAFVGAASLAVDPGGTAHLILRDSSSFHLLYFTGSATGGWSKPETAVTGHAVGQIDYPYLTYNVATKTVVVFFQDGRRVLAAVRHPQGGWRGPFTVQPHGVESRGMLFPASLPLTARRAVLLWTEATAKPSVLASRVGP